MKIVILDKDTLGNLDLTKLKNYGEVKEYPFTRYEDTINRSFEADIVLTNKVVFDKNILDKLPNLKLICVTATGMNNIDLEYAKKLNISVKNVSGYSTSSVVQHTFMLALALIGKLEYYNNYTKSGKWCDSEIFTNLEKEFFEIKNKNWGIIGLGEIGTSVARVAKAFGANVFYYSTAKKPHSSEFEHKNLDELLKISDIISIHAPLNENTKNLISKKELNLLKDGAVVLNLGRGGIIDEDELAKAIDSKNLLVGLDVVSQEPINKDNALLKVKKKENLIITPHIAWASKEARVRLLEGVIKNIEEFLKNERK
jgi:glycerate dehydrogenase